MGYRSDVHILIYGKQEKIDALRMRLRMNGMDEILTEDYIVFQEKRVQYGAEDDITLLEFKDDYIKWYEDFQSVRVCEQVLELAEEMGLTYEFARIGEDNSDIEIKYSESCHYMLSVMRQIVVDYTELEPKEKTE